MNKPIADDWWPGRFNPAEIADRNRRAKRYAGMLGLGYSLGQIAEAEKLSHSSIREALRRGCPPFRLQPVARNAPIAPPRKGDGRRPWWTIPDDSLIRLAHEARDEIQRNLAAKAARYVR